MKSNYQPWEVNIDDFPEKENFNSQIKFILRYAILAPSTHNTQPWLFKIKEPECEVYYNPKLVLPEADSKTRDLHISMGCCIENLILAAKYFNIFNSIGYGPFSNKEQLAVVHFKKYTGEKNSAYEKMINTIPKRINARGIFYPESVPEDVLNNISFIVKDYLVDEIHINWITEKNKILDLSHLTADGLKIAYHKTSFRKEMSYWMRNSFTKTKEGIPGYALKMPPVLSFILPILVRWYNIGNFLSKKNYSSISSAPLVVVITAENENPSVWLKVGQLAERLFLEFNGYGWQTSIFVAAIEMGRDKEVQKIIGNNKKPQFLFVVGKVDSLHKPTPRHELEEKII
ncbi:MAG: hypothetical protein HY005_00600 [Candidatus Staskawiczbacteria bacterium]|nr:hypothetical protein [Candidatus Staskawiczbacteria bacterium]